VRRRCWISWRNRPTSRYSCANPVKPLCLQWFDSYQTHQSYKKRLHSGSVPKKRTSNPPAFPAATHGVSKGLKPLKTVRDAIADLVHSPGPHSEYTEQIAAYFKHVPEGGNWRHLPEHLKRQAMGASYDAGGGKTGFYRRLAWDAPSPTITGTANRKATAICHPAYTRPLSVKECARLQGFPDHWQFSGSMAPQYLQIGNAVPVHLGNRCGCRRNQNH
jgi:DNA (cytosine-5)-methyltransferase 1